MVLVPDKTGAGNALPQCFARRVLYEIVVPEKVELHGVSQGYTLMQNIHVTASVARLTWEDFDGVIGTRRSVAFELEVREVYVNLQSCVGTDRPATVHAVPIIPRVVGRGETLRCRISVQRDTTPGCKEKLNASIACSAVEVGEADMG